MSEEKRQAQRKESMKFRDVGAKINKNKTKQTEAQHSSPPCSLPPKAFRKPRKVDREKLAKAAGDIVTYLSNNTVTFFEGTMDPKQQSEPKERIENVWFGEEKGKEFDEDDQVMMITVKCCTLTLLQQTRISDWRAKPPSPSGPPSKIS